MALTINKEPAKVSLLNNIEYEIETDNMYSSAGGAAILVLNFTGIATAGQTIIFDNGTTLTGAAAPDDSGLQFKTTAATLALFIEDVVDCINSNYPLSILYTNTNTTTSITLVAKASGSTYTISLTSSYSGVSGSSTAGTDQTIRSFFSLYLLLLYKLRGAAAYNEFHDSAVFNNSQISEYNPASLLNSFVDSFLYPATAVLTDRSSILTEFYIRYAESFGSPPVVQKIEATALAYALPGRINKKLQQYLEDNSQTYWGVHQLVREFLTNHPSDKETSLDELQKLYYLVSQSDTTEINIKADIYFTDGTSSTQQIATAAATQYDVYELNINATDFTGITKQIDYYDIYIEEAPDDPPSVYSTRFRYLVDYKNYKHKREFIFRNSFGVYETARILDRSTEQALIDSQFIMVDLFDGYRNRQSQRTISQLSNKTTVLTGYIERPELMPFYLELVASPDAYEIIDNILYPITIDTNKVTMANDSLDRFNISFSYYRESDPVPYSTLPTPAFSTGFSNGFKII